MIRIARPKARTFALVALPVVAVAITVPTVAIANGNDGHVYSGCIGGLLNDGITDVEIDAANPSCGSGQTLITWNEKGVAGTNGAAGAQGVPGPQGIQGLPGVAGAAGVKGATGAAGKNGVSGYKMITAETKAKARTAATYTVKCKDGRVALGGGMNGTSDLILNGSGPTPDAKGWVVRVTNVAQKPRAVSVHVTCAFAG